jgi:uncharacterized membrane protein YsdA (DUF1294 family)/cold shock CspA family protein
MAQRGQLVQWNDERGFGFIEAGDGRRHFVHISAMGRLSGRPRIGDQFSFVASTGSDGRPQAKAVRRVGALPRGEPGRRASAIVGAPVGQDWRFFGALALVVLLAAGVTLGRIPLELAAAYAAMSVVSLIAYRMDKGFATANQWRTSEATLLGLDFCFGLPGGLLGQALFRHKTRKPRFAASTALILAMHLAWLAAFVSGALDANSIAASISWPLEPWG